MEMKEKLIKTQRLQTSHEEHFEKNKNSKFSKGVVLCLLAVLILLPSIFAIDVKVENPSSDKVMIYGLDMPVVFDINVTNQASSSVFFFYNLLGFKMEPSEGITINKDETKNLELSVYPIKNLNYRGYYDLVYYIQDSARTQVTEHLRFKIINLGDAFEVGTVEFDPEQSTIQIYLKNKENFDFGQMNAEFSCAFFKQDESFSLGPNEKKSFTVQLNRDDFKEMMAGYYTLKVKIKVGDKTANAEGVIKFVEKDILETTSKEWGWFVNTKTIEKINNGNIVTSVEIVIKKNIISRLFTTIVPSPDKVERKGAIIYYTWNKDLNPSEVLKVDVKTNWFYPFIIVVFILILVIIAKQYSRTPVSINKKVSFVNAKGGEFGLKVTLTVQARKFVQKVNLVDRLPPLARLYGGIMGSKPDQFNEKIGKMEWSFGGMSPGERKIISYIIYSKVGVIGRFVLPTANASYEKDGKMKHVASNKAFFVTEQGAKKDY